MAVGREARCLGVCRGDVASPKKDCKCVTYPSVPASAAHENSEAKERDRPAGTLPTPQPYVPQSTRLPDFDSPVIVGPPEGVDGASGMSQLEPEPVPTMRTQE